MDRRRFLSMLAVGAAASVVAPKMGILERLRSYFFAPRGGWLTLPRTGADFTLYTGARGGGKTLTLLQLHELIQKYYSPAIVAAMNTDSVLFERFRDVFDPKLVGQIGGIPLVSSPLVPRDRVIMMRGNWNSRECFPFPASLATPILL